VNARLPDPLENDPSAISSDVTSFTDLSNVSCLVTTVKDAVDKQPLARNRHRSIARSFLPAVFLIVGAVGVLGIDIRLPEGSVDVQSILNVDVEI